MLAALVLFGESVTLVPPHIGAEIDAERLVREGLINLIPSDGVRSLRRRIVCLL
jgi:hypothetical protein